MSNRIVEAQDGTEVLESEEVLVDLDELEEDELEGDNEDEVNTKEDGEAKSDSEDEYNLPDKFKGKTVADIVESYNNLEREYGRRNNEVGELRKLTDQLLELERSKETQTEEADDKTIDADSLLENPQEAINKSIENNPTLKKLTETITNKERAENLSKFEGAHPDWKEVMGSEDFLKWIGQSQVRAKMLIEADQNYDYDTGSVLLNEFKLLNPADSTDDEAESKAEEEKLEQDRKAITTEKKSKSKGNRKKIYKRTQLIDMKINRPDEYAAREDEFMLAYAEKRVR